MHRHWPDIAQAVGAHPAAIIVEATGHYHAALESAQVDRMKRETKKPNG